MKDDGRIRTGSTGRLFLRYAAVSLVPVLLLGVALAASFRAEAERRGLAEAQSEAQLVAQAAVEPLLEGHDLAGGLSPAERAGVVRLLRNSPVGTILRLRIRDVSGRVVFSGDGSGLTDLADDEALDAGRGEPVTLITRLNTDSNDRGPSGEEAVEAYRPLTAGPERRRVGVLELYLPYAPIRRDVTEGLNSLYRDLTLGLGALYVVLFGISLSVSRGLRRQVAVNKFLAEHDALTGLPNRSLFHRRAQEAVDAATASKPAAIAIIDLDRFKEVNDSLGHHNGDRLLVALGDRLARHMRHSDTVARLGGDEFGVIIRGGADAAGELARLRAVMDQEVGVNGVPLALEASVGFALAPTDGTQVDELLQQADVAMYVSKSEHAGVARYDPARDHYDAANLALIADLRHAIDAGQLTLHYQPKAALFDGHIEAVEALLRWHHPRLGTLMPGRFLPLAEQTELIDKLTEWVLARAATDIRRIADDGAGLAVAVNVSARSLARLDFAGRVMTALDRHGLPPTRLIIEITETALLANPDRAAAILAELDAAGVRVS
ncbi:MAG TPA: diguanylate cyclase, partial [Kineosporiaceae bacterium]|nr:diguanylate cyclase [Kineosporiaceae bacterium]